MFLEKGMAKLLKALGNDVTEHRWYEQPLYRFIFEKESGETVSVEGGAFEWDEGEAVVYNVTDDEWAVNFTVYPLNNSQLAMKMPFGYDGLEEVKRIPGVIDHEKEALGRIEWDLTVDPAEETIESVERTKILDGTTRSDRWKNATSSHN